MFQLRFTNLPCSVDGGRFDTLDLAIEAGRKAGFEFSVWMSGRIAASWTVFGGMRRY